jgi:benzoyl-CoA reductase subunit D
MITAGIDMGAKRVKVVLLRDGEVIARSTELTGFQQKESASKALAAALQQAELQETDIDRAAATGAGRKEAPGDPIELTEVTAAAIGAVHVARSARTVIDVQAIPMNAQCAVFAESEVVSLLHAKTPKADIARAVHDAIANRIVSMARKVGINEDVVVIGGVARNVGFIDSVERELELKVKVPEDPEYVSALGAALHAANTEA